MPEYLSPGVYIEEVETGAMPIAGVGTSTAGFLGETERGPTDPTLVTSYADFRRVFGGRAQWNFGDDPESERSSNLTYAVEGFFRNGGTRCYIARIAQNDPTNDDDAVAAESALSNEVTATAVGPGLWGNNVLLTVEASPLGSERFNLRVRYWYAGIPADAATPPDNPDEANVPDPDVEELYADLSLEERSTDYYATSINGSSDLVQVTEGATVIPAPEGPIALREETAGADAGAVGLDDFGGYETEMVTPSGETRIKRTGLTGFGEVDEIAIVCAPDETVFDGLRQEVVNHCQDAEDRFAVLQANQGQKPGDLSEGGLPDGTISDRGFAAFYYPWLRVLDPLTNVETLVPPGGHVAGLFARTDTERGVHKAPANEQLRGVQGLEHTIRKVDQDGLNPKGINCIRSFRGSGIRVWGARTTSPRTTWRYVNVRRLFLYLEESIDEGTQWAVFEPNDEKLWARVKQSVSNFLTGAWRDGALMGTTPEEAFYVRCDRSTMTQTDIDLGRLIVEVGVAPVKPAEFVIFRITQWTGGAEGA